MRNIYKYILLSILAVGAVSCNKSEIEEEKSNDISFEVFTGVAANSEEATKGERYNSETEFAGQTFGLYAWNSSVSDTQVYENEPVSKTGGKWKPATSKKWEDRDSYVFEAVYPKPSSPLESVGLTALSVNKAPGSLTFSYKVPTTTMDAADKDFMLAYYSGSGNDGKAPLTFTHPLTCVNFKAGTMNGVSKINSITLKGVYESGSCTVRTTTYGTDSRPCYSYEQDNADFTSLWTPAGNISVTGTSDIVASTIATTTWAYNFLLIPQKTATQAVKLTINITDTAGSTYNISTTINTDYWRAGYTNTYKINFSAAYDLVLDPVHVAPWDTVNNTITLSESYTVSAKAVSNAVNSNGGNFQIYVSSFSSLDGGVTTTPEPWTVEYSDTGKDGTWSNTRPSMISSDISGTGSSSPETQNIPVGAQTGTALASLEYETAHTEALKAANPKVDFDLSLYNPATGEYRGAQSTANCYIVNASGSYKFPLVYGNAIKNGAVNTIAYAPGKSQTTGITQPLLAYFVNCKDKAITSPYIKTDIDALTGSDAIDGSYSAELLWQDVNGLILSSGLGVSGDYLTFQVSRENIHQGNAIIALKKGSTIVWSWHIWVTDEDMTKDNLFVTSSNVNYRFMNVNLGQIDKGSVSGAMQYAGRDCYVRIVQTSSGKRSQPIKVTQSESITGGTKTNSSTSTTYQWGRKDALFCSNSTNTAYGISGNSVTAYTGVDSRSTSFDKTIGNLIQNPTSSYFAGTSYNSPIEANYYNLWNNGEINGQNHIYDIPVVKTIYDPCPVGFYVPSIMAFKGFSTDGSSFNRGWSFSMSDGNSLYMPANGYRVAWRTAYAWTNDGTQAYYFSCTADANYASGVGYSLIFKTTNSSAADSGARSQRYYCCSIRPVKE